MYLKLTSFLSLFWFFFFLFSLYIFDLNNNLGVREGGHNFLFARLSSYVEIVKTLNPVLGLEQPRLLLPKMTSGT
jgi:hypothetical protein